MTMRMNVIKHTIFGYLLVFSTALCAQHVVKGVVMDAEFDEPLMSVTIQVDSSSKGTSTGFDGTYSLSLPLGETSLTFSYIGLETQVITIDVNEGGAI